MGRCTTPANITPYGRQAFRAGGSSLRTTASRGRRSPWRSLRTNSVRSFFNLFRCLNPMMQFAPLVGIGGRFRGPSQRWRRGRVGRCRVARCRGWPAGRAVRGGQLFILVSTVHLAPRARGASAKVVGEGGPSPTRSAASPRPPGRQAPLHSRARPCAVPVVRCRRCLLPGTCPPGTARGRPRSTIRGRARRLAPAPASKLRHLTARSSHPVTRRTGC